MKFAGLLHSNLRGAADAVTRHVVPDEGVGLRQRVERVHRPDAVLVGLPAPAQPNAISANDSQPNVVEMAPFQSRRRRQQPKLELARERLRGPSRVGGLVALLPRLSRPEHSRPALDDLRRVSLVQDQVANAPPQIAVGNVVACAQSSGSGLEVRLLSVYAADAGLTHDVVAVLELLRRRAGLDPHLLVLGVRHDPGGVDQRPVCLLYTSPSPRDRG